MLRLSPSIVFLAEWARSPLRTAAVWPSSSRLGDAMAQEVPRAPGLVLELGGGTGAVTRSLLRRGVPATSLVVIEKNPRLCRLMAARHPGTSIVEADARELRAALKRTGRARIDDVHAVVSGLGMRAMSRHVQAEILGEAFAALAPGGRFIQFTYGLRPPLDSGVQGNLRLGVRRAAFVLRNLPPASVYVYTRL